MPTFADPRPADARMLFCNEVPPPWQIGDHFESASVAGGMHGVVLSLDKPFVVLGVCSPGSAVDAAALTDLLALKARANQAPFMIAWTLREAAIWKTPAKGIPASKDGPIKRYPTLFDVAIAADPLPVHVRIELQQQAQAIIRDLGVLHRDGRLDYVLPDATFFVQRLTRAVGVLAPPLRESLRFRLEREPQFVAEVLAWAVNQGIPADVRSEAFQEAVTRQAIYRLLGKIIFYQSLRRSLRFLPELHLTGMDSSLVMPTLRSAFAKALEVDYHAVFAEDLLDRLSYPKIAAEELAGLVHDLNSRDFAGLPHDVVGRVFEELIPRQERHTLGQYFTPENLVDLICAFCVRHPDDAVLDPTCGTGTFLIRAYDRLRWMGVQAHNKLLSQIWGVDIAPFPAELATINLFRQRVDEHANFPRIICNDFLTVAPGSRHRFPPLKASAEIPDAVDEPMPQFDAVVGNFPFIGADQIERRTSFEDLRAVIAKDWFVRDPDLFEIGDRALRRDLENQRQAGRPLDSFVAHAAPLISTSADLYIYLYFHAARFLKPGGRMGIITSNAWLDVNYGSALQRFFLRHFKIVAILESRCEPWFEDASVNTVATILERCDDPAERDAHLVRFVKVQQPLAQLLPQDMRLDALARWQQANKLIQHIEGVGSEHVALPGAPPVSPKLGGRGALHGHATYDSPQFRVRVVRQGDLRAAVDASRQTVKWGRYLRAPEVYFELLAEAGDRLALLRDVAPPARGSLTGINEFYHLDEATIAKRGIESEFLFPLLKSPGESDRILIDQSALRLKVFVCRLTKEELRTQGKTSALQYIEWGEQQVFTEGAQAGQTWPHGAEVRGRKPAWYALPEYRSRPAQLFFASAYGDRHLHRFCGTEMIADKRLYFLSPVDGVSHELAATIMNSNITALSIELAGRVTMGDGALELTVEDAADYMLVPDVRSFSAADRDRIVAAFQPLLQRPIGNVFSEVRQPDRQALDQAVLAAMGLDAGEWLPRIYDGLTMLVHERSELGKMRNKARKSKGQRAVSQVAADVVADLFPDGARRFPGDFWSAAARAGRFNEVELPAAPLRHAGHLWQQEEVEAEGGFTYMAKSKAEAKYLIYAQKAGQTVARLPAQPVEMTRTVADYENYVRQARRQLYDAYYQRTLDQRQAQRLAEQAEESLGLATLEI